MSRADTLGRRSAATWLAVLPALVVPLSLLWDYSWEFTIGVETVWAAPHVATYLAVAFAAVTALAGIVACTRHRLPEMQIGRLRAPLGLWMMLWGSLAYLTAFLFDRWWQAGYGQSAGIWHPPQLLKAVAFFAITMGAWLFSATRQQSSSGGWAFAAAGGAVLALIFVVTLPSNLANRQHSAALYQIVCGTYPLLLIPAALLGRLRWSATATAFCYMLMAALAVWFLPMQPGQPMAGPVFNARDHLLPTPFPLLVIVPAVAIDLLLRVFPAQRRKGGRAVEAGLAFFFVFSAVQWPFAAFLLSPAANNRFFAGGGVHWPAMQPIGEAARVSFWPSPGWEFDARNALIAIVLAVAASAVALWMGGRLRTCERKP